MTYDQIVTLDTIVKYGSFKAASEVLHKSQPSLSAAIKKLELEYSIKLFDRSAYRPVLTSAGEAFYKKSQNVIEEFQRLENLAKELGADIDPEINICIDALFPIKNIQQILERFFEPHITTTLNVSIDILEGIMDKLVSHQVDFALGTIASQNNGQQGLESIQISTTPLVPVIGKKHFDLLNDIDSITQIPQIILRSHTTKENNKIYGAAAKKFWYTTDLSMKEQLIEAGFGWGRLPIHQIQNKLDNGSLLEIKNIPLIQTVNVPLYLMRSKTKVMGPNTKRLWTFLAEK